MMRFESVNVIHTSTGLPFAKRYWSIRCGRGVTQGPKWVKDGMEGNYEFLIFKVGVMVLWYFDLLIFFKKWRARYDMFLISGYGIGKCLSISYDTCNDKIYAFLSTWDTWDIILYHLPHVACYFFSLTTSTFAKNMEYLCSSQHTKLLIYHRSNNNVQQNNSYFTHYTIYSTIYPLYYAIKLNVSTIPAYTSTQPIHEAPQKIINRYHVAFSLPRKVHLPRSVRSSVVNM